MTWTYLNENIALRYLFVRWLAPFTQTIYFQFLKEAQKDKFDTRLLPRKSKVVSIQHCNFQGTVNLQTLPCSIQALHLNNNILSGTVHLIDLPETLCFVNLSNTFITTVLVDENILTNDFGGSFGRPDREGHIEKIVLRNGKINNREFVESYYIDSWKRILQQFIGKSRNRENICNFC